MSLSSSTRVRRDLQLDLWLRWLDEGQATSALAMHGLPVEAVTTLDARLAWQAREGLELAITGQNLLEDHHPEYLAESFVLPSELPRSASATATWKF